MRGERHENESRCCQCPYCNISMQQALPFCQLCGAVIVRCKQCGKVLGKSEVVCPTCGRQAREVSGD